MGKIFISVMLSVIFLGCATSKKTYTSSGNEGYSINCGGAALNWGMCYEKAGKICGKKGYKILEKTGDKGAIVSGNMYGLYGGTVLQRTMIIECKE